MLSRWCLAVAAIGFVSVGSPGWRLSRYGGWLLEPRIKPDKAHSSYGRGTRTAKCCGDMPKRSDFSSSTLVASGLREALSWLRAARDTLRVSIIGGSVGLCLVFGDYESLQDVTLA